MDVGWAYRVVQAQAQPRHRDGSRRVRERDAGGAALEAEARQKAIENLLAKANQLAEATGLVLGKPVSLVESRGFVPQFQSVFLDVAVAEAAPRVATSINPGELEVTISVQGVFSFE